MSSDKDLFFYSWPMESALTQRNQELYQPRWASRVSTSTFQGCLKTSGPNSSLCLHATREMNIRMCRLLPKRSRMGAEDHYNPKSVERLNPYFSALVRLWNRGYPPYMYTESPYMTSIYEFCATQKLRIFRDVRTRKLKPRNRSICTPAHKADVSSALYHHEPKVSLNGP